MRYSRREPGRACVFVVCVHMHACMSVCRCLYVCVSAWSFVVCLCGMEGMAGDPSSHPFVLVYIAVMAQPPPRAVGDHPDSGIHQNTSLGWFSWVLCGLIQLIYFGRAPPKKTEGGWPTNHFDKQGFCGRLLGGPPPTPLHSLEVRLLPRWACAVPRAAGGRLCMCCVLRHWAQKFESP